MIFFFIRSFSRFFISFNFLRIRSVVCSFFATLQCSVGPLMVFFFTGLCISGPSLRLRFGPLPHCRPLFSVSFCESATSEPNDEHASKLLVILSYTWHWGWTVDIILANILLLFERWTYFRIVAHASAWTHNAKPVALGINITAGDERWFVGSRDDAFFSALRFSRFSFCRCSLRHALLTVFFLSLLNFYQTNGMSCRCQRDVETTK